MCRENRDGEQLRVGPAARDATFPNMCYFRRTFGIRLLTWDMVS